MENLRDEELISNYRGGDAKALEELVNRYFKTVYRFIYRLVKDEALGSDLTQTTFIKVWKNLNRFDIKKSFKTWILTIAKNTTIDELRKREHLSFSQLSPEGNLDDSELMADPEPLPSAIFEHQELEATLNSYLAELSVEEKTIILLHLEDDLTFADIADSLGKPLNTVKSLYRRALLKLRERLTKP